MAPKRSSIWFHFIEVCGKDKDSAKCLHCGQVLSTKNGSMGNLTRHMKLKHITIPIKQNQPLLPVGEIKVEYHDEPLHLQDSGFSELNITTTIPMKQNQNSLPLSEEHVEYHDDPLQLQDSELLDLNITSTIPIQGNQNLLPVSQGEVKYHDEPLEMQDSGPPGFNIATSVSASSDKNDTDNYGTPIKRNKTIQSDIQSFTVSEKPLSVAKSQVIDQQLLQWIVKGYHSFRVVEEPDFQKFCEELCPDYELPSQKSVSDSLLDKTYQLLCVKIKQKIDLVDFVCVTIDSWTTTNHERLIALAIHFISEEHSELKLNSHLLECFPYKKTHTGANLAVLLQQKFEEWNIENKVDCVVSDTTANILTAVHVGGWKSRNCFALTINLLVQNGLKGVTTLLDKVKAIGAYFTRNSLALAKLRKMQVQMGLPELKLKQDEKTRWNSTLDMVEQMCLMKKAIISTLALKCPRLNNISATEWSILNDLVDILQIYKEITIEVSAEKEITISKILIFVYSIYRHLILFEHQQNLEEETKMVVKTMLDEFYRLFRDIESDEVLAESTILDPRFKKYGFQDQNKFATAVENLRHKLESVSSEVSRVDSEPEEKIASIKSRVWFHFDENVHKVHKTSQETNSLAAGFTELDRYLSEPLLKRNEDPLFWWESHKHVYPHLFCYMKKRLCIQATLVPYECRFSKAGQVLSEKATLLKSKKVCKILFLNTNL